MKAKLLAILSVLTMLTGISSAAVTVNTRNFTSTTAGIGILSPNGSLATSANTFFAAVTFAPGTNFNRPVSEILQGLTIVSNVVTAGVPAAGLINTGISYNGGTSGAPTPIVGSQMYIIIGDGNTILNSNNLAIFNTGITFAAGDAAGNATLNPTIDTVGKVVYGVIDTTPPITSPAGFTLPASVQLTNVPEPSALLLGGLGLLAMVRRRR